MASFSSGAFDSAGAFSVNAWDFGGAPVTPDVDRGGGSRLDLRGQYPSRITEFRDEPPPPAPVTDAEIESAAEAVAVDLRGALGQLEAMAFANPDLLTPDQVQRLSSALTSMAMNAPEELAQIRRREEEFVAFMIAMLL